MKKRNLSFWRRARSGQALVEYALILAMVAILFGVTLAATGPAIGDVFSNVLYNIIGGRPEDLDRLNRPGDGPGLSQNFWATVEWLATNPPEERAFAGNTPLPPPPTATLGPSPTPSPITPSPEPSDTPTSTPTNTPMDEGLTAPWLDTIDNPEWWRVSSNVWLGSDQFYGEYFANNGLSGDPEETLWHEELVGSKGDWGAIDFNWPSGSGPIEGGFTTNDYSVRWTRQIGFGWLEEESQDPRQVQFSLTTGGGQAGARVWLYEAGSTTPMDGCSGVSSGGSHNGTGSVYGDGQSPSGSQSDCLVIDGWRDTAETLSVTRTLQPRTLYIVQVDFYKRSGSATVKLEMNNLSSSNPDDMSLVSGSAPECSWHRAETKRSNSHAFIWEEAQVGEFPQNQLCYLELRGWVDFTLVSNPKLIFWDVWDMSNANTEVWVEVGEYKPDRTQIAWQQIPLRKGTTNYAWTRNVIDLASYVSGYSQKRLALRFAMRDNNGGARRRWYVDDIEIRNVNPKTFTVCTGSKDTCGSNWTMDNADATLGNYKKNIEPQFITTGRWTLTTDNAQGQYSLGITPALRSNETNGGDRIHYVEFNGLIDLTGNMPDFDGDTGVPVLTFHQAFDVRKGTQLELQWTRDPVDTEPDNWTTLQVLVADPGNSTIKQMLEETTVLLDDVPNWNSSPFRLRFAQIVKPNATENGGWWIDNVLLHRFDRPRFSDYPFLDTAQGGMDNWLPQGTWGITDTTNYTLGLFEGSGRAFTDSPSGNNLDEGNTSLILRRPIDLNFDTPENLDAQDDSNVQTAAANRPVLSFWHWRNIHNSTEFYVEWSNDAGQNWNIIWKYVPASATLSNSRIQKAWEYVEIDLSDIQASVATNGGNPYDDDVIFRFRLDARNSGNADGVYLDDIRVQDYSESSFKLWDTNLDDDDYGEGDGTRYVDDIDNPVAYWDRWKMGGWYGIDRNAHSGLISLHDSPPKENGSTVNTEKSTYNVLTMDEIIDLRAVSSIDNPTLYFWTHYYIGSNDNIQVQIAREDEDYTTTNGLGVHNPSLYDYERVSGWGPWQNRWEREQNSRVQTWFRAAVDLRPYVGERIKVRFVYNALNTSTKRDGWFIDDVIVEQRTNTPIPLPFSDNAKSLGNWIVEGSWGLAPDQWRGSGGGPANLGNEFWTGVYYDCERHEINCGSTPARYNDLLYTNYNNKTKRPYNPSLDIQEFALEIDHDFGSNGRPVGGLLDQTWSDTYAARWERPIAISVPSDISFITVSDDGVRLRYSGPGVPNNPYWNIIDVWTAHGRRVDMKSVHFEPGTYTLTLEWFEATGDAVIIASAGVNNFSFADSPKAGNSPSFPVIKSTQYGDSSMILRNPIDLTGTTLPVIEYWTRYKMSSGTGRFEVSTNGGFDWVINGLGQNGNGFTCPPVPGTPGYLSNASPMLSCNPVITGTFWPTANEGGKEDLSVWQQRQHNLTSYRSSGLINIRFNLQTSSSVDDGWYITDIIISP